MFKEAETENCLTMIIQVVNTVKTRLKFQLIRLLLATNLQRIKENGHEVWRLDYLVNQPSARALGKISVNHQLMIKTHQISKLCFESDAWWSDENIP